MIGSDDLSIGYKRIYDHKCCVVLMLFARLVVIGYIHVVLVPVDSTQFENSEFYIWLMNWFSGSFALYTLAEIACVMLGHPAFEVAFVCTDLAILMLSLFSQKSGWQLDLLIELFLLILTHLYWNECELEVEESNKMTELPTKCCSANEEDVDFVVFVVDDRRTICRY